MPRGGARPGAGKPKGYKHAHTLERDAAKKHLEKRIMAELDPLIDAQFKLAKGLVVMMSREKDHSGARTGRVYRVSDPDEMVELLNGPPEEYFQIVAKDPDGKMLKDLMDRLTGKPKETIEVEDGAANRNLVRVLDAMEPRMALGFARAMLGAGEDVMVVEAEVADA